MTTSQESIGIRRAIEDMGFLENPARVQFFGRGEHHGKRFSVSPSLGLSFESPMGTVPISSSVALEGYAEMVLAMSGPEYGKYLCHIPAASEDGDAAECVLMSLILCLEEDPLAYRLAQRTIDGVAEALLDTSECVPA